MSTNTMSETRRERDRGQSICPSFLLSHLLWPIEYRTLIDRKSPWRRPLCLQIGILRHPYRTIRNHFRPKPYSPTPRFPSSASFNPSSSPFVPRRPGLTPSTSAQIGSLAPTSAPPSPITFRRLSFFSIRSDSTGTRSTLPKLGRRDSQREEESVEVIEGDGEGEGEGEWWWYRGGPERRQMIGTAEDDEFVRRVQWENDW